MIIADLEYISSSGQMVNGGTNSNASFFGFYRYSTASTYGYASAVSGVVSSNSYAYSFT